MIEGICCVVCGREDTISACWITKPDSDEVVKFDTVCGRCFDKWAGQDYERLTDAPLYWFLGPEKAMFQLTRLLNTYSWPTLNRRLADLCLKASKVELQGL